MQYTSSRSVTVGTLLLGLLLACRTAAAAAQPLPQHVPEDAEAVSVDAPYVDVYTGPGRGYPIFHALERGEIVWLLKQRTDWVKVTTRRGHTGWVRVADLEDLFTPEGEPLQVRRVDFRDHQSQTLQLGFTYGDFAGADSMGVNLGYRFTANLSGEFRATQAVGQFSDSQTYQLAVLHQPFPRWRVSPYFMLGTGVNITSPNATIVATEDRQDTAMLTGFGIKTFIARRFALRAEVANHYLLTSRENNQEIIEWKLGFDVFM